MSAAVRHEKTYLVRYVPAQIEGAASEIIEDAYIPESADHGRLRLRHRGDRYQLSKRFATDQADFSTLSELTIELTGEEYAAFRSLTAKVVRKRRFYCTIYGRPAEVDVFLDELDGLMIIDFPFNDAAEMSGFQPPEVCLADITQEPVADGGYLAGKTYGQIQYELERFDYVPQFIEKEY
ncbi:hypothetical protein JNJ66_05510 [Candidatus Saccharibacteria bacterium]|nr:hypothetical protein [Candidatus Saccharibacteria bacterium]